VNGSPLTALSTVSCSARVWRSASWRSHGGSYGRSCREYGTRRTTRVRTGGRGLCTPRCPVIALLARRSHPPAWVCSPTRISSLQPEVQHHLVSLRAQLARSWALCGSLVPSSGAGTGGRCRFRVEPAVTQPAPPQTRTCAINAYGSSVTRVFPPLWRITLLPCQANQMLWTILGMGRTYVSSSFWNFSQPIALLLLRRLIQYCHAFSAQRLTVTVHLMKTGITLPIVTPSR